MAKEGRTKEGKEGQRKDNGRKEGTLWQGNYICGWIYSLTKHALGGAKDPQPC